MGRKCLALGLLALVGCGTFDEARVSVDDVRANTVAVLAASGPADLNQDGFISGVSEWAAFAWGIYTRLKEIKEPDAQ